MTLYALLRERCGLSIREAAAFHNVREDTVKSWSAGRNSPPVRIIGDLRALYGAIETAADHAIIEIAQLSQQMGNEAPSEIELGLASTEAEARSLGLPCVGAHAALLGIIAARVNVSIVIVPRGSTEATQAAVRRHDLVRR